jgi:hypothetical protein
MQPESATVIADFTRAVRREAAIKGTIELCEAVQHLAAMAPKPTWRQRLADMLRSVGESLERLSDRLDPPCVLSPDTWATARAAFRTGGTTDAT